MTPSTSSGTALREERESRLQAYYQHEIGERAARGLDPQRAARRDELVTRLKDRDPPDILEVGCGGGRDGVALDAAAGSYVGVDLTAASVEHCRGLGLIANRASVLDLPFDTDSFDVVWSMSTLLHVSDADLPRALAEIARVTRPGGLAAVGVWGGMTEEDDYDDGTGAPARFFARRSDADLRGQLVRIGTITTWATWSRDHGQGRHYHYQYAEITVQ